MISFVPAWSLYLAALAISATGLSLHSLGYDDAFVRSGAVLVVFAIFAFPFAERANDKAWERTQYAEKGLLQAPEDTKHSDFGADDPIHTIRDSKHTAEVYAKERHRLARAALQIAGLGTAIWGFGDLVGNRLVGCGQWQC